MSTYPDGIDPVVTDTEIADLSDQARRAENVLRAAWANIHRSAGDQQERRQHVGYVWTMSSDDALAAVQALFESTPAKHLESALRELHQADDARTALLGEIRKREGIWREYQWSRYYPCRNADGHIHSSERGCSTVRWDTPMGWYPDMSGKTFAEAVASKGPTLCSVCFPSAPVEWRQKRSDIEREQRLAAKRERDAARAAKTLRGTEEFRDHRNDCVTTVARCKEILRDEVQLRDYFGRGEHPWHQASVLAAQRATKVLLAREEREPGTGATQAQIDTIIENAVKKNRREGARI